MRTLLFLALVSLIFASCQAPKDLEYRSAKNFQLNQLGFSKSKMSLDLVFYNPNKFGLDLKKVDSDVYLDNIYLGKFQLDTLMHISKSSEFVLPSSVEVDMQNLMKNAVQLMFKKEMLIRATGSIKVGKAGIYKTLPFNYEGRQEMNLFK